MMLGSTETIKQAVMAGLGISAVSRHSVTLEMATQCLVELPVQHFPLLRSWYVVHHRSKQLSPVAQASWISFWTTRTGWRTCATAFSRNILLKSRLIERASPAMPAATAWARPVSTGLQKGGACLTGLLPRRRGRTGRAVCSLGGTTRALLDGLFRKTP